MPGAPKATGNSEPGHPSKCPDFEVSHPQQYFKCFRCWVRGLSLKLFFSSPLKTHLILCFLSEEKGFTSGLSTCIPEHYPGRPKQLSCKSPSRDPVMEISINCGPSSVRKPTQRAKTTLEMNPERENQPHPTPQAGAASPTRV